MTEESPAANPPPTDDAPRASLMFATLAAAALPRAPDFAPAAATFAYLLEAQRATTDALGKKIGAIIPWVFHRTKRGRPLKGFTKSWRVACVAAGLPGRPTPRAKSWAK